MFARTLSALAAAGLTAATLALATPIHAAPADEDVVTIAIGDVDLSTAEGAASFDRRVRAAARSICGTVTADLNMRRQVADCQDEVSSSARTVLAQGSTGARQALAFARRR